MLEPSQYLKGAIVLIVFGLACLMVSSSHVIAGGQGGNLEPAAQVLSTPNMNQSIQTGQSEAPAAALPFDLSSWEVHPDLFLPIPEPVTEPDRTLPIYRVYKRGWPVTVTADLQWFIRDITSEHGVCERQVFGLILKESTFDAGALGDRGRSLGLGQINRFWITGANIERITDDWRQRDLLCPYDNITTMIELFLHASQRYSLDLSTDHGWTQFVFWYMTGRDPRNITTWAPADQAARYAAELQYYQP